MNLVSDSLQNNFFHYKFLFYKRKQPLKKSKLLVIKTGQYETFNPGLWENTTVSLGDVLRSTIVLHSYLDYEIDWLTSVEAKPLLQGITQLDNIFVMNEDSLDYSKYDLIVNLELDFTLMLNSSIHPIVGFIKIGDKTYIRNKKSESVNSDQILIFFSEKNLKTWNQKLGWLLDSDYRDKNYFITPPSSEPNIFKIGLNWKVGSKLKDKSLDYQNWEFWFEHLSKRNSVSWQKGEANLIEYINWINSCESILTCDSLGLHIGLALKKKIYAFFKVTSPEEIEMCGHGKSYFLVENSNLINILNSDGSQNVIKEEIVKLF